LRHLNPLPPDIEDIMRRFKHVACAEMNMGQLATILRGKFLIDIKLINKIQGKPFKKEELIHKAIEILEGRHSSPYLIETLELLTDDKKSSDTDSSEFARYR